jgi:outer membrane immunogenic protein
MVMKAILLVAAAAGALLSAQLAQAADLPSSKMAPAAPAFAAYDWTGFYVGVHGGYGWGKHHRTNAIGFSNSYDSDGWLAGVHAGYNHQVNQFVLGVEADLAYADIAGDDGGVGGILDETRLRWMGSIRGRVGLAFDRLLIFATGGWAFADLKHTSAGGGLVDAFTTTRNGWTVGGGLEYALTSNWLVRAEYRYADLGSFSRASALVIPFSVKSTVHTARVGLSYKF